jgi:acyl homoserine lactone synthase
MHALVANPAREDISPMDADGIHHLRYQAFRERLHWDIPTLGERERDDYDDLHPVYVIVRDSPQVLACCRLLPTTGRYMLRNTFPELLGGSEAPVESDVWEISRFAVTKEARAGLGFTALPAALIRETARFAVANGIREYVFVTTTGFERLLTRMGVHLERFGPPLQIGVEKSVAIRVFMDEQTIRATRADCDNDPFLHRDEDLKEAA